MRCLGWLFTCVLCMFLCRATSRAPSVTSVSPASSTYQSPTLKAVCAASAWASPKSAPAPLGIETRLVATNGERRGGSFLYQGLTQCLHSHAVSANPFRCKISRCDVQTGIERMEISAHVSFRGFFLCLSGSRWGERAALLPRQQHQHCHYQWRNHSEGLLWTGLPLLLKFSKWCLLLGAAWELQRR